MGVSRALGPPFSGHHPRMSVQSDPKVPRVLLSPIRRAPPQKGPHLEGTPTEGLGSRKPERRLPVLQLRRVPRFRFGRCT